VHPAQPTLEGPVSFVDGEDVRSGGGWKGCFGEDEAEVWAEVGGEAAALGAEDAGVCAAAVEAEDPWVMERWIGCWCHVFVLKPRMKRHVGWSSALLEEVYKSPLAERKLTELTDRV
jgi:hypothetical protein